MVKNIGQKSAIVGGSASSVKRRKEKRTEAAREKSRLQVSKVGTKVAAWSSSSPPIYVPSYDGTEDISVLASALREDGIVVINVVSSEQAEALREAIAANVNSFPEFRKERSLPEECELKHVPVAGGFGALGNAASFHSPLTRRIREGMLASVGPIVLAHSQQGCLWPHSRPDVDDTLSDKEQPKIHALFERQIFFRPAGTTVPKESFHRDNTPAGSFVAAPSASAKSNKQKNVIVKSTLREGDEIFGCLMNLDKECAGFDCVLGTHLDVAPWLVDGSFDKIEDPELLLKYKQNVKRVMYAQGQAVLFYQHLVHSISPPSRTSRRNDRLKVCCALRLTEGDETLFPNDAAVAIEEQGVPLIKSGQRPPMYPSMLRACYTDKPWEQRTGTRMSLREWSTSVFRKEVCEPETGLVKRFQPSLRELGCMYEPYSNLDRDLIMVPRTSLEGLRTLSSACGV